MILKLLFYLSILIIPANAGNCCDRSRNGYAEFRNLAEYLHRTDLIESFFKYNNLTDVYSIEKQTTILFKENQYYFDDYYEQYENRTKVCVFKLYRRYDEIDHVVFTDGSRPRQVVYGCHADQECCEIGCCSINTYFYFWILYPGAILLVLASSCASKCHNLAARVREMENIEDDEL